MSNFVSTKWLSDHLEDENVFVLDIRFDLFDPALYGRKAYDEEHIKGAYYLDMDTELSQDMREHGGRRWVADEETLGEKLSSLGISMDSVIVCYDDGIYAAPRAWWQLKYMGYENVYVLDGGLKLWKEEGYPTSKEVPASSGCGSFLAKVNSEMYADKDIVCEAIENGDVIIDSRSNQRYTGEVEPLYSKKGHIPTAKNLHYLQNLNGDNLLADADKLKKNFELVGDKNVIFYCGSGIEGCVNFMAYAEAAGEEVPKNAKLYVGSMSDWVTYDELSVEGI